MFRLLLTFILTTLLAPAWAQFTLGLPEITNYRKQAYRGGAQTRRMVQDRSGLMYFANDEGVLRYDGVRWKLFPLPNRSLVRCLQFGPDGQLYVGGQDEVGYFEPASDGSLRFRSLKPLLPAANRSFADVWEIHFVGTDLFFQTSTAIYRVRNRQVQVYPDEHWRFMGVFDGQVVAQSKHRGLLVMSGDAWQPWSPAAGARLAPDLTVTALLRFGKDSALLTTLRHGAYLLHQDRLSVWETPALKAIGEQNISSACRVNEQQIALGTSLDGCYVIDRAGRQVQHFSRHEGLQDNSILSVFLDSRQNLWLGLHDGIDFVPYNNAITHLGSGMLKEGAGYSAPLFDNQLYLATSVGLFRVPVVNRGSLSNNPAQVFSIARSAGDAWNLSQVDGRLLLGHNEGAFLVKDQSIQPLDQSTGFWAFRPLPGSTDRMVAGSYKGISFFRLVNGSFMREGAEAVVESARFIVPAYGKVWFSHPYKGVYAVWQQPDGSATHRAYGRAEGVLSVNNNYLFWVRNQLLLTTDAGVLVFRPQTNRFEPSAFFNQYLPRVPIRYLKEDSQGNIWFVFEKKVGVLDLSSGRPQLIYLPELTNKFVAGFEHINPIDPGNVLIGGEKGFYHINYARYKALAYPLQVKINALVGISQADTLLYGGYGGSVAAGMTSRTGKQELQASFNALRFEFAAPAYGQLANVEYSYKLAGFDKGWSAFDAKTEKEYTNLPPGDYIFQIKARNNLGSESGVQSYPFTVLPPWYRTVWAYLFYVLTVAVALYQLFRYWRRKFRAQQQRHEEEQRRLLYLHQLEMDKAEKEMIALRNAKLEAELQAKNTELASAALHLVQKSDVLQKVKEQMSKLRQEAPAGANGADLKKILRTLNDEHNIDEQWHQFAQHFDITHHGFLAQLRAKHPALTPNDQKLCAYLKMNLSTKEIAQLMNITPRGVEISRYRLRKKLEVPKGMHLFNFLDGISSISEKVAD